MKENILLFPGWMQDNGLYGDYSYVDLWQKDYTEPSLVKAQYLLGHSMGALSALLSWQKNPNTTVILFNPLISKRTPLSLLLRFVVMMFISPGSVKALKGSVKFKYLPIAISNALFFTKIDALEIIKKIPKDKLIIIRGKNDKYFCDLDSIMTLQNSGFSVYELDQVNHFWCSQVDEFIKQFIN